MDLKTGTAALGLGLLTGCSGVVPFEFAHHGGSIGYAHRGILRSPAELPLVGTGFKFLRNDDRHFALPRFARVLQRAAARVEATRPGATLVLGDLSKRSGGKLLPHLSHRSGRDADLLLFATTLEGAPVHSPGFIHFGSDGIGWDPDGKRFLRFDVERQWFLIKSLIEDEEAHIQWIFVHHAIKAHLLAWGRARGEDEELLFRAAEVMQQPRPGGKHDDHVHVRIACNAMDIAAGCKQSGPPRHWLAKRSTPVEFPSTEQLALEILR